jgi:hypothetical protein
MTWGRELAEREHRARIDLTATGRTLDDTTDEAITLREERDTLRAVVRRLAREATEPRVGRAILAELEAMASEEGERCE